MCRTCSSLGSTFGSLSHGPQYHCLHLLRRSSASEHYASPITWWCPNCNPEPASYSCRYQCGGCYWTGYSVFFINYEYGEVSPAPAPAGVSSNAAALRSAAVGRGSASASDAASCTASSAATRVAGPASSEDARGVPRARSSRVGSCGAPSARRTSRHVASSATTTSATVS